MVITALEEVLNLVVRNLGIKEHLRVIKSNRPDLCDYQCDDVFRLSKIYGKSPIEIGESITNNLNNIKDFEKYFQRVEFVKPGFINMIVSDKFINSFINKINNNSKFNISIDNNSDIYFLDYGGPNIAKPLHVGHLRPAIIGESMKRIINFLGYKTYSDVHLGDYGLQIGQVIYGILGDEKNIDDITLDYLEYIYPKMSKLCKENLEILNKCREITRELQDGNLEYNNIWKVICNISITDIKRIYEYLDISFDLWNGESDSYKYIGKLIEYLENKGIVSISEGAKIIEVKNDTDNKEMPPFILVKNDGAYLYSTTDLATIMIRNIKYKPNYILYFTDSRQQLHFEQVFRAWTKSNINNNIKLEHIGFGTINGIDGKPFKTRSGDPLKLDDLFNIVKEEFIKLNDNNKNMNNNDIIKIVNSIIKYADLQNNIERNYIFDINKFSNTIGKTGPYILYTYLRINKVINEINEMPNNLIGDIIYNKQDRDLRMKLIEIDIPIKNAFDDRMPSYIADYIYDLSNFANTFYQNNHIKTCIDDINKKEWIFILTLTNKILKQLLELLIIEIPSEI